jgi:uncharacterized phage protein (predicted DNA packaging)
MLDYIKEVLRISAENEVFDNEISDLLAAAEADLILSGILDTKAEDDTDPLIRRALSTYVKAHFGWNNPDADRLARAYDSIKSHLALSQEYTVAVV